MTSWPQLALFVLLVVLPLLSLLRPLVSSPLLAGPVPTWSAEEPATVPDGGELVGPSLTLLSGRRYRAGLSLPEGVTEGDIVPALSSLGFADVRIVGAREGLVMVEARWANGDQTSERPDVLARVWLLPEPPAPAVAAPAPEASQSPAPRPPVTTSQGIGAMQSINDQGARKVLGEAWALERPNETLTPQAEQSLLAVARHESYYGQGWKKGSPMENSYNWGAIQSTAKKGPGGECPPGTASQGDSRPTPQGQVAYTTCFKTYDSHLSAARDLIRTVYRGKLSADALHSGDLDAVAWGMRQNGYFGGFCAVAGPSSSPPCAIFTPEMAAAEYADALARNAVTIASRIGEPLAVRRSGSMGVVPRTAADGSAVYPAGGAGGAGGASGAGAALVLLLVAGCCLAHEKGWL